MLAAKEQSCLWRHEASFNKPPYWSVLLLFPLQFRNRQMCRAV